MPKTSEATATATAPAPATTTAPLAFCPATEEVYAAALLLSTPAKDRDALGRTREAQTAARETLVLAAAALLLKAHAPFAGVQVRTADGGSYPLSRMVRIMTCGDSRTIGRIVGRA